MANEIVSLRAGTLAVVKEDIQNLPKRPTAGTEFTATQPDLALSPGQETLENEELKNAIMNGKPIIGRETPTFTMSHYYRSGDISTGSSIKPDYSALLEAATGLVHEVPEGSEQAITAVTDARTFEVADATGYAKGSMLLVQAATGSELRPIASINGNEITLGFDLENVPNIGALIGAPVCYEPLDDSNLIPTLSLWYYLQDTIQMESGVRIEGVDLSFPAAELINASFTGSGTGFYFDPLVIDATNDQVTIEVSATPYTGSIPQGTYKDPHQLAEALTIVMNNLGTGETFTVEYDDAGKYVATGSNNFGIDGTIANNVWLTAGFDAVLTSEATSHTSVNDIDLTSGLTPIYDSSDPISAKGNVCLIGSPEDNICVQASNVDVSYANTKADLLSICPESGIYTSLFNGRTMTATVTSYLTPFEAKYFRDMRTGDTTSFFYGAGEKLGGFFLKQKCAGAYMSHATITSLEIEDNEGAAMLTIELSAFAPSDSTQSGFFSFV